MRLFNHIVCLAAVIAFIFSSCSSADKPADGALPAADSTAALNPAKDSMGVATSDSPTEIFEGTYLGKALLFSHKDFQKFNYKEGDLVLSGVMNTEKGYGDDRSATVYVLNSDKPKNEQKFIVRGSNGSVYLLDQDRFVVDEANFAPAKVTVTPIPEIKPESRPVETKPVAAKKTETKKKIASKAKKKKTVAAKKAPAKKAVKANKKKKKKAVRKKARKKSRNKKTTSANSNKETPQN